MLPTSIIAVRGQGEDTFLELLEALRGRTRPEGIPGLSYKDSDGTPRHNPERPLKPLDEFPWYPYHRIPAEQYLLPTFSRAAHGGSPGQHRVSLPLQLLRGRQLFREAARRWNRPRAPKRSCVIWPRTYGVDACAVLRQQLFPARRPRPRTRRPDGTSEPALVVRGARRHHDALLGRDLGSHPPLRVRHDFLRRRIGLQRNSEGDAQGPARGGYAGSRFAHPPLRHYSGILDHLRQSPRPGRGHSRLLSSSFAS